MRFRRTVGSLELGCLWLCRVKLVKNGKMCSFQAIDEDRCRSSERKGDKKARKRKGSRISYKAKKKEYRLI